MPLFWTTYDLPRGGSQCTSCYARDEAHLAEVVAQRGLNERRCFSGHPYEDPPTMPSEHYRKGKYSEAVHAMVWVGMVASKAGLADAWSLLNDRGLLHQLSHCAEAGRQQNSWLLDELQAFERTVPGVHPSWGGEEEARFAPSLYPYFYENVSVVAYGVNDAMADFKAAVAAMPPRMADPNRRGFFMDAVRQGKTARLAMAKAAAETMVEQLRRRRTEPTTVTVKAESPAVLFAGEQVASFNVTLERLFTAGLDAQMKSMRARLLERMTTQSIRLRIPIADVAA